MKRLFVALALPEATRTALADYARRSRTREDGWRWVAPEGMHLTLRFYGATGDDRAEVLRASLAELCADSHALDLEVRGIGAFPSPSRPRVLWTGVTGPHAALESLAALATAAEHRAREAGFEPEDRAFHPHVTLARAVQGARPRLPSPPGDRPVFGPLPAHDVVLYESHLGPGGARYTVFAKAPLRPGHGGGA